MGKTTDEVRITHNEVRSKTNFDIRYFLLVFFVLAQMFGFSAPAQSSDFEFMNLWLTPEQKQYLASWSMGT